jgi:hypothetical protein|tara:strand:+ start:206 stop:613 length:408 start_codon:yes stop_codon:yes gene_type:complete
MKFKTLTGSSKRLSRAKNYLINWTGPSRSKAQKGVKDFLEEYWKHHVVFEEFPMVGTKMTFDFYNANKKVAVEVQGDQHTKFVPFFHGRRGNFASQLRRDEKKLQFCNLNKIKLIEIYSTDTLNKALFSDQGVHL